MFFDFDDDYNALLLELWTTCCDQLISGPMGPVAFDLKVLPFMFDLFSVDRSDWNYIIADIKVLTAGLLRT